MKKIKLMFAALLVAVVSVLAVSCSKSDSTDPNLGKSTYTVRGVYSEGGLNEATLNDLNADFPVHKKENVTLAEAKIDFYSYVEYMQTKLTKAVKEDPDITLTKDLKVTMTLYDSKGNWQTDKYFYISKK